MTSPHQQKKVLLVSLAFPPAPQVGALRVGKLAEYLPSVGWTPVVLTLPVDCYTPIRDPATGRALKPLTYRARPKALYEVSAVNPFRVAANLRKSIARPVSGDQPVVSTPRIEGAPSRPGWRYRLGSAANHLLVPDEYAHWVWRATLKGKQIIKRERPDAIWAFFPHASNLLTGYLLSRASGLPLLLDFRDPWTGFVSWATNPRWRSVVDTRMERRILDHAKAVSVVNDAVAEDIIEKAPSTANRIHALPQGIDFGEAGEIGDGERVSDGVLRIGYGGTLSRNLGDPERFLNALGRIVADGTIERSKIRVRFIGHSTLDLAGLARNAGVEDMIENLGHKERYESLRTLIDSDLLLLINDRPGKIWITGKIWDYLTLRRPILALVDPESAAATLLNETQTGSVVAPWDDAAIERELRRIIVDFERTGSIGFDPDEAALNRYSMDSVAHAAADILESV